VGSHAAAVERRTAADLQEACHGEGQPQEGSRGTAPRSKANRAGPKGNLMPASHFNTGLPVYREH
jgi:hypothetical protein